MFASVPQRDVRPHAFAAHHHNRIRSHRTGKDTRGGDARCCVH
jgi:hypothetical protein